MVKIYANLCEQGLRTCIEAEGIVPVPAKYIDGVKEELILRGRGDLAGVQTP